MNELHTIIEMLTGPAVHATGEVEQRIDKLTDDERRQVRKAIGDSPAPKNLYFNYDTQRWIP